MRTQRGRFGPRYHQTPESHHMHPKRFLDKQSPLPSKGNRPSGAQLTTPGWRFVLHALPARGAPQLIDAWPCSTRCDGRWRARVEAVGGQRRG